MIVFVDLGHQITKSSDSKGGDFAFYDTIYDQFVYFDGNCIWDCKKCFIDSFTATEKNNHATEYEKRFSGDLERFTNKIPKKFHEDCISDEIKPNYKKTEEV